MKLIRVFDRYEHSYFVADSDFNFGKMQIPLRCKSGKKLADLPRGIRPDAVTIHRDNIARFEPLY